MNMTDVPLPLVYAEQHNPPARPTRYDRSVREAIADGLMSDVVEWFGVDWDEAERDAIRDDLCCAIARDRDGFERARYLADSRRWSCDSELVEILDSADGWTEERAAVAAWVEANRITAKLAVGARVSVAWRWKSAEVGTITGIDDTHACYVVKTDAYLRESPDQAEHPGSEYIIPFENVTPETAA